MLNDIQEKLNIALIIIIIFMMQNLINFKILVLGTQGVGKTCLIGRYLQDNFDQIYNVTVGVEFASKVIHIEDQTYVRLQIWDTAGQQMFRALVRSFYRGISAVFLVYSIDKAQSLRQLKSWVKQVRQHSHQQVVLFLIGAKSDREEAREVDSNTATAFLREIQGALYVQTSSKTGQNIQLLFKKVADYMYKKFRANKTFRALVQPSKKSNISQSVKKQDITKSTSIALKKSSFLESPKDQKKKKCCG